MNVFVVLKVSVQHWLCMFMYEVQDVSLNPSHCRNATPTLFHSDLLLPNIVTNYAIKTVEACFWFTVIVALMHFNSHGAIHIEQI